MDRHGLDATFSGQIFRKDHPMVISSNRHLATLLPVRLAYDAGGYKAGQILALDSVANQYKKFSAVSGSYQAACVLFEDVSALGSSGTALARGIFGGEVFTSLLLDYSATAKTQLGARDIVDSSGVGSITKF